MEFKDIKQDKRNYRIHDDRNKDLIKKSIEDCGLGRSILVDSEGYIIAGNGVFEKAKEKGIDLELVETDGSEVIALKRVDLDTKDTKRKRLALLDNQVSDTSYFNYELLREDLGAQDLEGLGIEVPEIDLVEKSVKGEEAFTEEELGKIGEDVKDEYLNQNRIKEIQEENQDFNNRVIIVFKKEEKEELEKVLGVKIEKVVYKIEEIMGD